tara:strand:- start:137 stop:445 length:309 start_codon:yes stop_codon:yes gene_type:complete
MKKGKLTDIEIACIKGMIAEEVSSDDMAKQLNRSVSLVEKEVKKISEQAVRDQLTIKKSARGQGGIVAMTEAGSVNSNRDSSTTESPVATERSKWVHSIYGK